MRAVDRSFDDLVGGISNLPLQITNEQRSWQGSTLFFSFAAKIGFLRSAIKGIIEVTDRDVTIDADLGLLEKLLSVKGARATLEGRIRGLLK
jgi:hypothetical protein